MGQTQQTNQGYRKSVSLILPKSLNTSACVQMQLMSSGKSRSSLNIREQSYKTWCSSPTTLQFAHTRSSRFNLRHLPFSIWADCESPNESAQYLQTRGAYKKWTVKFVVWGWYSCTSWIWNHRASQTFPVVFSSRRQCIADISDDGFRIWCAVLRNVEGNLVGLGATRQILPCGLRHDQAIFETERRIWTV